MATEDVWRETLHNFYGDQVVRSRYACLHCLVRGSVTHQWHEEAQSPQLVLGGTSAFDHCSLWRIGNEPLVFVSQPYGLSHEDMRTVLDFCDQNGLQLEIDERASFHNPGAVVGLTIWNRDIRARHRAPGE